MSVRRDLAAHLAATLGEAVTVVATSHRADLTPPWVTVDHGSPAAALGADADAVWTAYLEVVAAVGYGGADALVATDALETLVDAVLDAVALFADVAATEVGGPTVDNADRGPLLTQPVTVRHLFRICPPPPS